MPNWCENDEIIVGPKEEIRTLYDKLTSLISEATPIYGSVWLFDVLKDLKDDYNCRGYFISDPICEESQIRFATLTAWQPVPETWQAFLREQAPNSSYYFFSVEPSEEFAITNDTDKRFWEEDYITLLTVDEDHREELPPDLLRIEGLEMMTEIGLQMILESVTGQKGDLQTLISLAQEIADKYGSSLKIMPVKRETTALT